MPLGMATVGLIEPRQRDLGGAPPPPPDFAPDDVAGLFVWWETDMGVGDDVDGVYEWIEQTLSGNDFTQTTGSKKPELLADYWAAGIDGIQGDAINDYLVNDSNVVFTGDFSLFFVLVAQDAGKHLYANDSLGVRTMADEHLIRNFGGGQSDLSVASSWTSGEKMLLEIHRDGADDLTAWVDTVDRTKGTITDSGDTNFKYLFARSQWSTFNSNVYGAIVGYDNKVGSEDHDELRTYFNSKYILY